MWKDVHKFESRKEIAGGIKRRFPKRENKEWERGKIALILLKRGKEEKGGECGMGMKRMRRGKRVQRQCPGKPDKRRARRMVRGERDENAEDEVERGAIAEGAGVRVS